MSLAVEQQAFVKKEDCDKQYRSMKWMYSVLLAVSTIFLGLVIYTASQAADANVKFNQHHDQILTLRGALEAHIMEQKVTEKSMIERLVMIQAEIASLRNEQKTLLEKILELQIKSAASQKNG